MQYAIDNKPWALLNQSFGRDVYTELFVLDLYVCCICGILNYYYISFSVFRYGEDIFQSV